MRKKKRRTAIPALLLAVILGLWQTVPSHAEPDMEEVTFPYEESSASRESILTGTIKVELISVSLPAGGFEFEIDTGGEFSLDNPGGQFGGSGIPITNRSMVPVQVEITQVAEMTDADLKFQDRYTDEVEQSFRLVDQIAKVGPLGTAILVMGVEGQTYQSAREFEQNAILPERETSIFITEIPSEGTKYLKLYGKVAPDFFGEYQFTVRPTIKISAARP